MNLRGVSPFRDQDYRLAEMAYGFAKNNDDVLVKIKSGILPDQGEFDSTFDPPVGDYEDRWARQFQYKWTDPEGVTIFSFGRDGQPGGTGFDADIYHDQRNYEQSLPTLRQFYAPGLWTNSIVGDGGVFAFVVSLFLFCRIQFSKTAYQSSRLSWRYVVYVLFVFGLAAAIGVFLLPTHVPSGH